ncbi:glycosyltransferase family 2 protein [Paenibacillus donghaensis]|uniref:Glycosyltransferase 2-like domain-containing protein n=1 Tax=Paenibacillus donghaensis TaxID=414771 RepID=A0A2Z2KH45_9BACL|nr:glycosyltransferase [Paenibacillus donghaensis]ASA25197.1 hypothetical protein B9T62_33375 [Paenibacillus donghaensis]
MNLSIVVPVYNIENYVTYMLDSLLGQTQLQFETIIVDDGSTDHTHHTVHSILSHGTPFPWRIVRTRNQGVSAARNTGLRTAAGTYVLFLDGDDYVSAELVQTVHEHTRETQPDIICWGYDLVREDKSSIVSFPPEGGSLSGSETLELILRQQRLRIWTGSVAFNREFLQRSGLQYTAGCVNGEDQEFIYKALARADRVTAIPDVLSYYVQRTSSITNSYNVKKFGVVDAFKRVDAYFKAHPFREQKAISELLLGRELTENYFYNLKTTLNSTRGITIQALLQDIEQHYPGMNRDMRVLMKRYNGTDRLLALQIKAFLLSPALYHRLIHLDNSWTQFKRTLKSMVRKEINV